MNRRKFLAVIAGAVVAPKALTPPTSGAGAITISTGADPHQVIKAIRTQQANGGVIAPPKLVLIGEKGPETVIPLRRAS